MTVLLTSFTFVKQVGKMHFCLVDILLNRTVLYFSLKPRMLGGVMTSVIYIYPCVSFFWKLVSWAVLQNKNSGQCKLGLFIFMLFQSV